MLGYTFDVELEHFAAEAFLGRSCCTYILENPTIGRDYLMGTYVQYTTRTCDRLSPFMCHMYNIRTYASPVQISGVGGDPSHTHTQKKRLTLVTEHTPYVCTYICNYSTCAALDDSDLRRSADVHSHGMARGIWIF